MKYNNDIYNTSGLRNYSLIDCITILFGREMSSFEQCLPAVASGIAAVLFLSDKIEQRYKDITVDWNTDPALLKNILRHTGREYEVIQKFGGVYNEPYYIYRIVQSLKSHSPILCKSKHARENWNLLIGYDSTRKLAYLKTPMCIIESKNLYQDIDDMIIFSNEKTSEPMDCLPNDFINAVTTMEHIALSGSGKGDAYDRWIRFLKNLSCNTPEMYEFHHHLLRRLLRDRSNLYVYLRQEAFFGERNDSLKHLQAFMHFIRNSLLSDSLLLETFISQVIEIQRFDQLLRTQLYSYFK